MGGRTLQKEGWEEGGDYPAHSGTWVGLPGPVGLQRTHSMDGGEGVCGS